MGRKLKEIEPDEIRVFSDKVKESGLGYINPTTLQIIDLAYARYLPSECVKALEESLPYFNGEIEGRPKYEYITKLKGKRALPYQCSWRPVALYERVALEMLVKLLGLENIERYVASPNWYIIRTRENTQVAEFKLRGHAVMFRVGEIDNPVILDWEGRTIIAVPSWSVARPLIPADLGVICRTGGV